MGMLALAWTLPLASLAAPATQPAGAERPAIGLGAVVGDPLGANIKVFLRPRHALQSSAGFGPFHLGAGRIDLTYLFHSRPWSSTDRLQTRGYVGLGVGVAFWHRDIGHLGPYRPKPDDFEHASLFFRAPVLGVAFLLQPLSLDVFLETAYSPLIGPPITYWNFDFVLGARYWF